MAGWQLDARATEAILGFWFAGDPALAVPRAPWFRMDPAFDGDVAAQCGQLWQDAAAAARAGRMALPQAARTALALVVLLDQVPRNIWRGTGAAFSTDAAALAVASDAVDRGFDRALAPVARWFLYLPFEHAEDIVQQDRAVALFKGLPPDSPDHARVVDFAERHRAIVARWGRFPHRNAALGRATPPAEAAFLATPGSSF